MAPLWAIHPVSYIYCTDDLEALFGMTAGKLLLLLPRSVPAQWGRHQPKGTMHSGQQTFPKKSTINIYSLFVS